MSTSKITNYSINTDYINTLGGVNPKLVLMQERAKTLITLSSAKYTQELDYGASEFVKEDLTQNVILFGVAGKNGDSIQVTGTDSKRISWSGMFYSSNAIGEKQYLESILNAGNPMSFKAFYNKQVYTVIVQSASFEIRRECYITYSINLIEYNPIIYTAIKKDFWTQIPQNIGSNPGNPNLTDAQADLCADSVRFHCENALDDVVVYELSSFGGNINVCLNTSDIFSCNLAFMAKYTKEKVGLINAILNLLCEYFRNYFENGAFVVINGVGKTVDNGLNCVMGVSSSSFSKAFEVFLTSGCYEVYQQHETGTGLYDLKGPIDFLEVDSDGKLCLTAAFIASLDESSTSIGKSLYPYAVKLPGKPPEDWGGNIIEVSLECAKYCMGEKAFNDWYEHISSVIPNSGAEFTVELRYVTLPYAELSVRQNVEGKFTVKVFIEATPGGSFGTTPNTTFNLEANGDAETYTVDMSAFTRNALYNVKIEIYKQTSVPTDDEAYRLYNKVLCYKSDID